MKVEDFSMVRFSEIEYQRPDIEALKALISEATPGWNPSSGRQAIF